MAVSRVYAAQPNLLKATVVPVETDLTRGLYQFAVVGLPDKAVEESRDRVSAAIKHSGFKSPKSKNHKVVISLAPADLKKEGPLFDLPMALSYLAAAGEAAFDTEGRIFVGELSLSGTLRPVKGALPIAEEARRQGFRELYVPAENAEEAALVEDIQVFAVPTLDALVKHLVGELPLAPVPKTEFRPRAEKSALDMGDIRGQAAGKRALEIAAAGGHNIALYGPPGTGKTMLARAFAGLLPPLSRQEAFEVTSIHSVAGTLRGDLVTHAPFRAPHHTASYASLVGGGSNPRPGEITLAHRGVLFLDEFPEFESRVLEALRQPLEDGVVTVARSKGTAVFPARFILVAAMNPCPCGFFGSMKKRCVCRPGDLLRYRRKVSGPIMDRIDLWVEVDPLDYGTLAGTPGEGSAPMRGRVQDARRLQEERFEKLGRAISRNSEMTVRDLTNDIILDESVRALLDKGAEKLELSARAYHKTIKIARTIADLAGSPGILAEHMLEALQYRPKMESLGI